MIFVIIKQRNAIFVTLLIIKIDKQSSFKIKQLFDKIKLGSLTILILDSVNLLLYLFNLMLRIFLILGISLLTLLGKVAATTQYKVTTKETATSYISLGLEYTGDQEYYLKQKSVISKNLVFVLRCYTFLDFDFKIYDPLRQRYEVPQEGIFPADPAAGFSFPLNLAAFSFKYTENPFGFQIIRREDSSLLFSTKDIDIIFSDYYIQIGTYTNSVLLYGFSERFTTNFRLQPGKWTMFPRDRGQMMDNGIGNQTHGYYPVYMEKSGDRFHMTYFRSSNALDVIAEKESTRYKLTYKVIGGIIDFRFFLGEYNPQPMVLRFQNYLGRSAIPPFWSLGFHQCRWGYKDINALETVIANFESHGIPLDTIWSDIDYMKDFQTFTIDEQRFPLDRMSKILHKYHYIPIIEPSIRLGQGYAYQQGKKRNIFIKDAEGSNDQIGEVWAGKVLFTDYFNPNATKYWGDMLQHLYDKIKFSGAWIDMNEISNLCNGPCQTPTPAEIRIDFTNDIPYHPGSDKIQTQAIPLNATHYGSRVEANVHTFFGFMETYATNVFLKEKGRPFIITRSNTLGSNKYGFHWTGDNYANYQFMRTSISSNFMFNFWGIQMVGSDICGFGGNATDQLCARWFQLGSLYPFARNHNQDIAIDQEPYALGKLTLASSIANLKLRYSILKAYYRQFIIRRGYGSIFKPLFFQFAADPKTFQDQIADTEFMVGNTLLSAPILEGNTNTRQVYFPQMSNWFDFHTGQFHHQGSTAQILNQPDSKVPLFLREGHLIFMQDTINVRKSSQLDNKFILLGAYYLDPKKSNSTFSVYKSEGGTLSIQDYNDETLIQGCISRGCDYEVVAAFEHNISSGKKTLILEVLFIGDHAWAQEVVITDIKIYAHSLTESFSLQTPVSITGSGTKTIDLTRNNLTED